MNRQNTFSPGQKISLTQKGLFDRLQYLELDGDDKLRVVRKTRFSQTDYAISLKGIGETGTRFIAMPWRWFLAAIAALVLSGVYLWSTQFFTGALADYWWSGLLLGLSLSVLFFALFIARMERKLVYYTPFARVPVLELMLNKPDRKSYQQFLAAFDAAVNSAQSTRLSKEKRLAGELKMLRRLRDQGILDNTTYDLAKATIFKLSDTKHVESIDY